MAIFRVIWNLLANFYRDNLHFPELKSSVGKCLYIASEASSTAALM